MPFWRKVYRGDKEKGPKTAQENIANDPKIPEPGKMGGIRRAFEL
jgi:hypothetical protein